MHLAIGLALVVAFFCLLPGVGGPFLLDDIPNLSPMGRDGGLSNPETWARFVWGGNAGPLGRPLSLLTFALQADGWPTDPVPLKLVNIGLHLLVGGLLFLLFAGLLRAAGVDAGAAPWVAAAAAGLWLLHPVQSSNVLYVIQRMNLLAALAMVVALLGWLRGRNVLLAGREGRGYAWMTGALVLAGGLGLFAKENVAVLPVAVLAVATTVAPVRAAPRPWLWRAWLGMFLVLPLVVILAYFARNVALEHGFANRPFDLWQRVSVQGVVLWDYVAKTLLPQLAPSLFHDDWDIRAVTLPMWLRLLAWAGWAALVAAALWLRRREPVIAASILVFLSLHLLEAGPVSLEIYFLHRNYLPMAFLLLGPVYAVWRWWPASRLPRLAAGGLAAVLALVLSGMLFASSSLWADNLALRQHWVEQRPAALRSHHHLVVRSLLERDWPEARARIQAVREVHPQASSVAFYELFYACERGLPAQGALAQLFRTAGSDWRRTETASAIRQMATLAEIKGCAGGDARVALRLADVFLANPSYRARPAQKQLLAVKFELQQELGDTAAAEQTMAQRLKIDNSPHLLLEHAQWLADQGRYNQAAAALERAADRSVLTAAGRWLIDDSSRRSRLRERAEQYRDMAGKAPREPDHDR